jgi:serine/threonine-protein kinase
VGIRRLALLVLACCAWLIACGHERSSTLARWTLHRDDAPDVEVALPAHFSEVPSDRPSTYVLRTRFTVPEEWRGRPLTFMVPFVEAPSALSVDGAPAASLEEGIIPGDPVLGPRSYRIDSAATTDGALDLALTIECRSTRGAWIDVAPRISDAPYGDREYVALRIIDGPLIVATFAILSMIGFTYLVLHFFDRRRLAHLYFALQAMGVAYYLIELIGLPQAAIGQYTFGYLLLSSASIAGVHFVHTYFDLPRPHVVFRALLGLFALEIPIVGRPFHQNRVIPTIASFVAMGVVVYQIVTLVRLYRAGRDRFGAAVLLLAWAVVLVTCVPDVTYGSGGGHVLGGACTLTFGVGVYSVIQAVVLGRDHIRSLRAADALNVELAARVRLLEERARENALLGEELRRQIADKSQRLAEALARIGGVPERVVSIESGDTIQGRYRAIRRLGEGGMGAVYEVERVTDKRRLALKVLTAAATGVALARLAREAQVAAQVSHPNLVSIVDVDVSESGALYLVMELVEGSSLLELRERFGGAEWARDVLGQIARGLATLHARGIVHRDLKPANVLVTREGVAKIADFGIARMGGETPEPTALADAPTMKATEPAEAHTDPHAATVQQPSTDPALTGTGVLIGTPLYMAPELARGARSAEASSDVWSFGVIAHELLTGALPFATPPVLAALAGKVTEPARLPASDLSDTLDRCLSLDPKARPTAAELEGALDAVCETARAAS